MKRKILAILIPLTLLVELHDRAQDLPASETEPNSAGQPTDRAPTFSVAHFKFVETKEALKMLEEAAAANESILAKQKESLSQLVELQQRAQAAKSAAAKSMSRK